MSFTYYKMSWDTMCAENLRIGPIQAMIVGSQLSEIFPGFDQNSEVAEVSPGNIVLQEDWALFDGVNVGDTSFDVQLKAYYDEKKDILFIARWEVYDSEGTNVSRSRR